MYDIEMIKKEINVLKPGAIITGVLKSDYAYEYFLVREVEFDLSDSSITVVCDELERDKRFSNMFTKIDGGRRILFYDLYIIGYDKKFR